MSDQITILRSALNAMLTQFGMDEDEWNCATFNQARAALASRSTPPISAEPGGEARAIRAFFAENDSLMFWGSQVVRHIDEILASNPPPISASEPDGSVNGFYPEGIAHLQPILRVACVTLDGTTLTVPVEELGDVLHEEGEHTYTVTLKNMTRHDFEALGEFNGF